MRHFFFVILAILFFLSSPSYAQKSNTKNYYSLLVTSTDLSEDMSVLSSGNDEILILAYQNHEKLDSPVVMEEFVFSKKNQRKRFELKLRSDSLPVTILIIEKDSKVSNLRIEAVCRIHQNKLNKLFDQHKTAELEEYLGDEELLSFCTLFPYGIEQSSCSNEYINNMDTYEYKVQLTKR